MSDDVVAIDKPNGEPVSARAEVTDVSRAPGIDYDRLARMVVREGKPFLESAIACGYSESFARKGMRHVMSCSSPLSDAIQREYDRVAQDVTKLKPVAVARLYREIAAPDSPNAMKAIELAGRFRETDWFVRNTEVQLGVFLGMQEQPPNTVDLDKFKE